MQVEVKTGLITYVIPDFNTSQKIPNAPHFTFYEAANPSCKESTKLVITDDFYKHAQMLEALRVWANKPFVVNSWYRSPTFNASVGGISTSNHLKATATDVGFTGLTDSIFNTYANAWKAICESNGIVGEAIYYKKSSFIHFGSFITYQKTFYKATKNQ